MAKEIISEFNGLYTATDAYSTPGSPSMNDWDVELNKSLRKAKGYEWIEASTTASAYLDVISITASNPAVVTVSGTTTSISASSTVILYGFGDTAASNIVANYAWNVSAVPTASTLTLEACDATSLTAAAGYTAKVDISMASLKGWAGGGAGVTLSNIECQGAYYDSTSDYIYSFLANKTESKSYLVRADKDKSRWTYVEGTFSTLANATAFGVSKKGWFDKYKNQIIFTKGETMSGVGTTGGTLCLSTTGSILAFGTSNNPTGDYLAVHKDRVWVGNIATFSTEAYNGKSWVAVSKLYPEQADTSTSLVSSGIVFGDGTARFVVDSTDFRVGDEVYFSGIVFSGVQDDINQRLFEIVGKGTNGIIVEYNNTNDLTWSSGGFALLRGSTWGPALAIYDDLLSGAGLFRCDDNNNDAVVQLKSAFGALTIFRQQNPYIFTGAIESGSQTLARPLNVSYGTVSPHTFMTAGGVWFVSQYGISKVEGTTIKTNQNQLDNIVDITIAEPIKPTFDAIANKANIVLYGKDRKLFAHDPATNITYVFDTLTSDWTRYYNRLVDRFVTVGNDLYAVYKHLFFKLDTGNLTFSLTGYGTATINSSYFTRIMDNGSAVNTKVYEMLYSLIEGATTSDSTNNVTINIYFDGSASVDGTITWDVKTGTIVTWNSLTSNGTSSWNTVTTTGTVTWASLLGDLESILQNRQYRLGSGRQIQLEIAHNNDSNVKISRLILDYDMLDVDTIQ